MTLSTFRAAAVLAAAAFAGITVTAGAQEFPSKPVRMIVPSAAGSGTDLLARLTAVAMPRSLGQPVIVENRPGGSSVIGIDALKQAPADGHSIMLSASTILMIPLFSKTATVDPARELVPVTLVGEIPFVLTANANMPFSTFAEFVAYARANPGKLNYGTPGMETTTALWLEFLKARNKLDIVNVTYQGSGQIYTALLSNVINMTGGITVGQAINGAKDGKLKPLAVSGRQRHPGLPDVPSYTELGYPEILNSYFYTFVTPATPRPAIDKLHAATAAGLQTQEAKDGFAKLGFGIVAANPEASAREFALEAATYVNAIKSAGIGPK